MMDVAPWERRRATMPLEKNLKYPNLFSQVIDINFSRKYFPFHLIQIKFIKDISTSAYKGSTTEFYTKVSKDLVIFFTFTFQKNIIEKSPKKSLAMFF